MKKLLSLAVVLVLTALAACSQAWPPSADATTPDRPVPHGPSGSWVLRWADEFNGTSVDLRKWQPNWGSGDATSITEPVNTAELSCYDPGQVTETGGALHLTAVRRPCLSWQYASGLVRTEGTFLFTYGYVEARMLLPGSAFRACTDWPAFWLNGITGSLIEEIDIMECLGGDVRWHYHWADYKQEASNAAPPWHPTLPQAPGGWHTFGVDWEPGSMTFYYDGLAQGSIIEAATHPHYLVVNLALSSTVSPPVLVPGTVSIDYVRVFERA